MRFSTLLYLTIFISNLYFFLIPQAHSSQQLPTRLYVAFEPCHSRPPRTYYWIDPWVTRYINSHRKINYFSYSSKRELQQTLSCLSNIKKKGEQICTGNITSFRMTLFFDSKSKKQPREYFPIFSSFASTHISDTTKRKSYVHFFRNRGTTLKKIKKCIQNNNRFEENMLHPKLIYRMLKSYFFYNRTIAINWSETTLLKLFKYISKRQNSHMGIQYQVMFLHFLQPGNKETKQLITQLQKTSKNAKTIDQMEQYEKNIRNKILKQKLLIYLSSRNVNIKFTAAYILRKISPKKATTAFLEIITKSLQQKKYEIIDYILNHSDNLNLNKDTNKFTSTMFLLCKLKTEKASSQQNRLLVKIKRKSKSILVNFQSTKQKKSYNTSLCK